MYNKHITQELLAYCHGELEPERSRQIAEHLIGCQKCRREYEEIKLAVKLTAQLEPVSAPDSMWNEIEAQLDNPPQLGQGFGKRGRFGFGVFPQWVRIAALATPLVLVIGLGIFWFANRNNHPDNRVWQVSPTAGSPTIASNGIGKNGKLGVGQWLETNSSSSARIDITNIGEVDVAPDSRIRLIETRPTEHRMELQRGSMHAKITAPPRLFFVNTPSAEAVDLGCDYTLKVDDKGIGLLTVNLGYVAFVKDGVESLVPVGAMCVTRPGIGPGTPYFHDAPEALKNALTSFDFEQGGNSALTEVLACSRERDAYTLWNLIPRVSGAERAQVVDRLVELVKLPNGVTKEGVLALDHGMLERWSIEFEWGW
jgi:hypothetical protein